MLLLKKENEIYKRHLNLKNRKLIFSMSDKFTFALLNSLCDCKKIANELKKINIDIHYTTVNKILQEFRKKGLIQPNGTWKKFLKIHWDSLFAMDFMTIDTLFGKRFYLLLVMELKTRKLIRFDLTENPCREFGKQRIELLNYHPDIKKLRDGLFFE